MPSAVRCEQEPPEEKRMLHPFILSIAERILKEPGHALSFEEACRLAALSEAHPMDLMVCAHKIRTQYKGSRVFTCAISNAKSGLCSEDCAFCAQSGYHRTNIESYPLQGAGELTAYAVSMREEGATNYSMVTSGYGLTEDEMDGVARVAAALKSTTDLKVCASLGMLTDSEAKRLRASGVSRYHHNLETARSHFAQICTTHDYEEDVETVRVAKAAGLEVCSGGIMGLGETWEQRVELAVTLRELDVDSIPINFLNPIPGTKMEDWPLLSPMEALRCVALFRFMHPQRDIPVCGGREVTLKDFQSWVFLAGANGLMIGDYLTTKGRSVAMDIAMIEGMGLSRGRF
jgi:biotin synthase